MKTIYLLIMSLLLSSITVNAQLVFNFPPCSNFNTNPASNWAPAAAPNGNVSVGFGSSNTFDGSQYLILGDQSYGSLYENRVDYKNLGKRFLGQCIYFDFYLKNDSGLGTPYHPNITLSDGTNTTTFVANVTVTPGSGWVRIKAPIQLSSGGLLPSNSEGAWTMATTNPTIFDNIMLNSTSLIITPEITSTQDEIVYFDNICVQSCNYCTADFKLDTSFSTLTNSATATLALINPITVSTPGNPGPTYEINWGDGTLSPVFIASVSHTYSNVGTYTICVNEKQGKFIKCTKCFTFCYKSPIASSSSATSSSAKYSLSELMAIAKAELQTSEQNDFLLVPNPAKSYVDLQTTLSKKERVAVRLIDISGKVMLEQSENLNSGRQTIKLNTEKLLQGTYIVEMTSDGKTSSQKLLISK